MKKLCFAVLCLLLLLAGCAKAPAEPAVTATTAPAIVTTKPEPTTEPTNPDGEIPWDFPEVEPMTYEEYFSEKREITVDPGSLEGFYMTEINGVILLWKEGGQRREAVLYRGEKGTECDWMILAKDRLFGIQDDSTVVSVPVRKRNSSPRRTDLCSRICCMQTTGCCISLPKTRMAVPFIGCTFRKKDWTA